MRAKIGQTYADGDADGAAEEAEGDGFDEELHEDGGRGSADGFAEADLAGALGDADEHDVHDADAADDEGDADETGGNFGDDEDDGVDLLDAALGVVDAEGVVVAGADVAGLAEIEGGLGDGFDGLAGGLGGGGDFDPGPFVVEAGEGDDDLGAGAHGAEEGGVGGFFEEADDDVAAIADLRMEPPTQAGGELQAIAQGFVDQDRQGRSSSSSMKFNSRPAVTVRRSTRCQAGSTPTTSTLSL